MDPHAFCREAIKTVLNPGEPRAELGRNQQRAVVLAYFVQQPPSSHFEHDLEIMAQSAERSGRPRLAEAARDVLEAWRAAQRQAQHTPSSPNPGPRSEDDDSWSPAIERWEWGGIPEQQGSEWQIASQEAAPIRPISADEQSAPCGGMIEPSADVGTPAGHLTIRASAGRPAVDNQAEAEAENDSVDTRDELLEPEAIAEVHAQRSLGSGPRAERCEEHELGQPPRDSHRKPDASPREYVARAIAGIRRAPGSAGSGGRQPATERAQTMMVLAHFARREVSPAEFTAQLQSLIQDADGRGRRTLAQATRGVLDNWRAEAESSQ